MAKRIGVAKRIGRHTFRRTYTTLLHATGEDVKAVQKFLRHGSARITMDVYAQAMTPAKRRAQGKVVRDAAGHREEVKLKTYGVPGVSPPKNGVSSKSFILLASPTGFEPVLPP